MSEFGIDADDRRVDLVAVGELDEDLLRALQVVPLAGGHDVRVRRDLAVAVEDEPGAGALLLGSAVEHAPAAEHAEHGHHARRLALVARAAGRTAAPLRASREDLDARRDLDGPRALGLVVTTQRAPAEHRARGDERARGTGAPHTGSLSANVVPADVVCTSRWPVMRSASSRAIVSPRPEPCASSDV